MGLIAHGTPMSEIDGLIVFLRCWKALVYILLVVQDKAAVLPNLKASDYRAILKGKSREVPAVAASGSDSDGGIVNSDDDITPGAGAAQARHGRARKCAAARSPVRSPSEEPDPWDEEVPCCCIASLGHVKLSVFCVQLLSVQAACFHSDCEENVGSLCRDRCVSRPFLARLLCTCTEHLVYRAAGLNAG
jgi:hypothetical protein